MDFSNLVKTVLVENNTSNNQTTMDQLQAALDLIGFEPTVGTAADVINTLISAFRAALSKEPDERTKHIINAGISAISLIPFADVLKLIKLRKNKPAVRGARMIKSYGKTRQSSNRFGVSESNMAGGASSVFGAGVISTAAVSSGDNYAPGDARTPKSIYGGVMTRNGMSARKRKKNKKQKNK